MKIDLLNTPWVIYIGSKEEFDTAIKLLQEAGYPKPSSYGYSPGIYLTNNYSSNPEETVCRVLHGHGEQYKDVASKRYVLEICHNPCLVVSKRSVEQIDKKIEELQKQLAEMIEMRSEILA